METQHVQNGQLKRSNFNCYFLPGKLKIRSYRNAYYIYFDSLPIHDKFDFKLLGLDVDNQIAVSVQFEEKTVNDIDWIVVTIDNELPIYLEKVEFEVELQNMLVPVNSQ
ncbi:MAG TPA: hypothetical protein PLS49_07890 [Candidatus Woesebacteria bacterium]|nr:hypothetical protein [Candidatus Woesebacteria bacterium]